MKNKKNSSKNKKEPLKEGLDFYIEKGAYVFTAHYLTQRGICCKNGCRHCPYRGNKEIV